MMMMDINNYYLGTPLPRRYILNALAIDDWVYIEIQKGMYVLKQAGLLANQLLQTG
jgi:hypothetical protein